MVISMKTIEFRDEGEDLYYGLGVPSSLFTLRSLVNKYSANTEYGVAQIGCDVAQSITQVLNHTPLSLFSPGPERIAMRRTKVELSECDG